MDCNNESLNLRPHHQMGQKWSRRKRRRKQSKASNVIDDLRTNCSIPNNGYQQTAQLLPGANFPNLRRLVRRPDQKSKLLLWASLIMFILLIKLTETTLVDFESNQLVNQNPHSSTSTQAKAIKSDQTSKTNHSTTFKSSISEQSPNGQAKKTNNSHSSQKPKSKVSKIVESPKLSSNNNNKQHNRLRNKASHNIQRDSPENDGSSDGQQDDSLELPSADYKQLALSITASLSNVRTPVGSNAILKCLISYRRPTYLPKNNLEFDLVWSRYMYDEGVYEQLDSMSSGDNQLKFESTRSSRRRRRETGPSVEPIYVPFDRQQQMRDFQARSRQEIKQISDLAIEAFLYIDSVQPSDNATYYCTATNHRGNEKMARIDLVALSQPTVQLELAQPARDSKSALIFWSIISDGNTPIKRTILMVRNQTSFPTNRITWRPFKSMRPTGEDREEMSLEPSAAADPISQRPSNVVIDGDMHQWQRIDIEGEGEQAPNHPSRFDNFSASRQLHQSEPIDGSRADISDIDVTSSVDRRLYQLSASDSSGPTRNGWQPNSGARRSRAKRMKSFNLTSLLPGFTYSLKLAALNDMGQSNWTELMLTMPNEIPSQITEVFLLSRKNDSLVIGWRRPVYDTSKTSRYEMQLFDLNRTITFDADTKIEHPQTASPSGSSPSQRTNFMYYFVNLRPGTDYQFHVRACSKFGCSEYSNPKLIATTLDGEPDEPQEVELECLFDPSRPRENKLTVSWLSPIQPRGQLINHTLLLDARSTYRNQSAQTQTEEWRLTLETTDNRTTSFVTENTLMPNTNYTVRVCANNRSKHCGKLSTITPSAQCSTPSALPSELPSDIRLLNRPLELQRPEIQGEVSQSGANKISVETLMLELPYISMRNGTIDCIQVVLIRLPSSFDEKRSVLEYLPEKPSDVELSLSIDELRFRTKNSPPEVESEPSDQDDLTTTTASNDYFQTMNDSSGSNKHVTRRILVNTDPKQPKSRWNKSQAETIAYIADELDESQWQWDRLANGQAQQVILGDGNYHNCQALSKYQINSTTSRESLNSMAPVFDAQLSTQTYYTGFLKLILINAHKSVKRSIVGENKMLTKFSGYFEPVKTGDSVPQLAQLVLDFPSRSHVSNKFNPVGSESNLNPYSSTTFDFANSSLMTNLREFKTRVSSTIRYNLAKWQDSLSHFLTEKARLESLSTIIMNSSPLMQLLEVGLIVIILTLLILMLVYFITLPNSRRSKRRLKQQQQQQKRNNQADKDQAEPTETELNKQPKSNDNQDSGFIVSNGNTVMVEKEPQQSNMGAQDEANGYNINMTNNLLVHEHLSPSYQINSECPIHSSPAMQLPQDPCMVVDPSVYHYARDQNYQQRQQYERNCRTTRRIHTGAAHSTYYPMGADETNTLTNEMTLNHQPNSVLALAKKISKPIPLRIFSAVFEYRLQNGWLREEYDQLPRSSLISQFNGAQLTKPSSFMRLQCELIVSKSLDGAPTEDPQQETKISTLVSGNERYDASIIKPFNSMGGDSVASSIICARSPLDADSVWDFWRLIFEQDVSSIVMLTHTEDLQSGDLRCAQYWPTCDNEETTILSPRNEFVQKSSIPAAKFKIRQETLDTSGCGIYDTSQTPNFKIRRLTLMVLPSRPSDNQSDDQDRQPDDSERAKEDEDDEFAIVERDIIHFQFTHWNMSSLANQMRLIKFVELANERHLKSQSTSEPHLMRPMLVHCTNGLGRSGLFAAMSMIIDELAIKLPFERQLMMPNANRIEGIQQQQVAKINIFQLVSKLRVQREMLLSPYRFYELLYQLTSNCVPSQQDLKQFYVSRNQQPKQALN